MKKESNIESGFDQFDDDKVTDQIDQASMFESRMRQAAIENAAGALNGRGPEWIDGKPCCRECGEEIPARRLAALPNTELCIECASANE